jgi:hypothetical protein
MSVETDIVFLSGAQPIYDPLKITAETALPGETVVRVQNFGTEKLTNLGLYVRPSSNVGPWDNPADAPPATDYQDVLAWGTESDLTAATGGIMVYAPSTSTTGAYVTKSKGSQWSNKIPIGDLDVGALVAVRVVFEVPAAVTARRLFINLVVG